MGSKITVFLEKSKNPLQKTFSIYSRMAIKNLYIYIYIYFYVSTHICISLSLYIHAYVHVYYIHTSLLLYRFRAAGYHFRFVEPESGSLAMGARLQGSGGVWTGPQPRCKKSNWNESLVFGAVGMGWL